ncbi:MAG: hypothetical protein CM15mP58_20460 [Burkholderiaceae bacterium]|nr:MAG: hypothetical protein CM15mP58_20460 [Burkholderiaceae bacterium]
MGCVFNLIRTGDIGFGERSYMQGKWETSDLYSLLLLALRTNDSFRLLLMETGYRY